MGRSIIRMSLSMPLPSLIETSDTWFWSGMQHQRSGRWWMRAWSRSWRGPSSCAGDVVGADHPLVPTVDHGHHQKYVEQQQAVPDLDLSQQQLGGGHLDRKSTRLNSSHT